MGLLLGGGGRKDQRTKTLRQFCASLIGTSWRLVALTHNERLRKSN
jgi:hypothetical protein